MTESNLNIHISDGTSYGFRCHHCTDLDESGWCQSRLEVNTFSDLKYPSLLMSLTSDPKHLGLHTFSTGLLSGGIEVVSWKIPV